MEGGHFNRFIGIDWSGAKDPRRGLQAAQCFQGTAVPQIVINGKPRNWRRAAVLDWLVQIHQTGEKVLAGFDFSFAYPYCDEKAYFPGHDQTPKNAESLWKLVDAVCQGAGDFYGGPFYLTQDAPLADYLLYMNYKGRCYSNRMRITDGRCIKHGGNLNSVFKCVGPESVGIGSIAGMRMLHHIKNHLNKNFLIWPFEKPDNSRSVIGEIYPTLFFRLAGQNTKTWRNRETINHALKYFGSDSLPDDIRIESKDEVDAIISAAAIRHLASNPNTWQPAELSGCAEVFEGWILGVE